MLIHRSKLATPTREQQVWAGMRSMNFDIRGYVIFNNFKSSRDNPVGVRVPPPVPSFPFVHGSGPLFLNSHPKTCPFFIISFIDQPEVIKKILEHLGLWEESHAPPDRSPPQEEIPFDSSYGSINSPSRGRSRDSQII